MTEFESHAVHFENQCSLFLRNPEYYVDLNKFYLRPDHVTDEIYNEWVRLQGEGKACYYIKNIEGPRTFKSKGTPIYHPKMACLFENEDRMDSTGSINNENNSSRAGFLKIAYIAGFVRGMAYCVEDLELREEHFIKNYSPEYLKSIMYFYNDKEVNWVDGLQKGSVFVKSYVPTKGMPEVIYDYGFHSCVVWYIDNLMEKFPEKFNINQVKPTKQYAILYFFAQKVGELPNFNSDKVKRLSDFAARNGISKKNLEINYNSLLRDGTITKFDLDKIIQEIPIHKKYPKTIEYLKNNVKML